MAYRCIIVSKNVNRLFVGTDGESSNLHVKLTKIHENLALITLRWLICDFQRVGFNIVTCILVYTMTLNIWGRVQRVWGSRHCPIAPGSSMFRSPPELPPLAEAEEALGHGGKSPPNFYAHCQCPPPPNF